MSEPRRALISVSDKSGLLEFVGGLRELGFEILSTGGTAKAIRAGGHPVRLVSEETDSPEILGGRVKTLHPKIHGALLLRDTPEHAKEAKAHGIAPIDLVVVNLYPFEKRVEDLALPRDEAVESIDIGEPTMLRSAAKNYERVCALVDPSDYSGLLAELVENGGKTTLDTRFRLAQKVFAHTAAYDGAIAAHLGSLQPRGETRELFPKTLTLQWERVMELRYGENPHQKAAFYRDSRSPMRRKSSRPSIADAQVLQGKALSYNNILDLDAALACCIEQRGNAAVIVKHTNPCGVASADSLPAAYASALACDPMSAFGGIVALNGTVEGDLAATLVTTFLECIVAPQYSAEALAIFGKKKNLRIVRVPGLVATEGDEDWTMRSVAGGILVQNADFGETAEADLKVVSKRQPTDAEWESLRFAWRVAKHIKSNAILFCKDQTTLGVGAGQMSRVDAAKVAVSKAQSSLKGSVVASDAFFPFRDGIDALAGAGATAVIQPGGSVRDMQVIEAADEHGMAMVFTGMRHFRH